MQYVKNTLNAKVQLCFWFVFVFVLIIRKQGATKLGEDRHYQSPPEDLIINCVGVVGRAFTKIPLAKTFF